MFWFVFAELMVDEDIFQYVRVTLRTTAPLVTKEERTPFTGFMEFKPADSYQQSLYSAMSPYWVGPDRTATDLKMDSVWR